MNTRHKKRWYQHVWPLMVATGTFIVGTGDNLLGWAERVVSWVFGGSAIEWSHAIDAVRKWWASSELLGNQTFQVVMTTVGAIALFVIAAAWISEKFRRHRGLNPQLPSSPPPVPLTTEQLDRMEIGDRVNRVKARLVEMVWSIDQERRGQPPSFFLKTEVIAGCEVLVKEDHDWKVAFKHELRGMLAPSLCKEYENKLRTKKPEVAAREFLHAVSKTLTASDLRASSTTVSVPAIATEPRRTTATKQPKIIIQ